MPCSVIHIPNTVTSDFEDGILEEKALKDGLAYLKSTNTSIQYGDLAVFDAVAGYRNDGYAIYDGEKLLDLSEEPDDYGTIPQKFHVLEAPHYFPLDYWHDESDNIERIIHNGYIWFDHRPYKTELLNSIEEKEDGLVAKFMGPDYKIYRIVFEVDAVSPPDPDQMKKDFRKRLLSEDFIELSIYSSLGESTPNTIYLTYAYD